MSISTVIVKPTKHCTAQCDYCSAPPEVNGAPKWSVDQFKQYFDKLAPYLTGRAVLIWHGGEPMLMPPDFYWKAFEYARSINPEVRFSIQSNLLSYDSKRWKDVFEQVFEGSVSTSFDPDERNRYFKGSTKLYSKIFWKRMDALIGDGFVPKIIGTYTDETADLADVMYERVKEYGAMAPNLRFNYRYPAGRDSGKGELISPDNYGRMIIRLYDRWIKELPEFTITPLDEMLKKVIHLEVNRCPWTRECGGRFLGIEPNGDVYNCSEFADLGDTEYRFGNIDEHTIPEMMRSLPARRIRRRRVELPMDCTTCRHFSECEGGCMRDAVLYDRGLGGKFYYCWSWKMTFDRIKESVRNGEADGAIRKFKMDPDTVRRNQNLHPAKTAAA
ncbi:radical SAM/SPASM domain-containing protein [Thalassospira xianhensis]|uniref:radical SAM/SPASM domain-containing protein n=1 Tax=Thalassospira xianhensis TaxID=478503 RepID=UPI000DEDE9C7|nr:radical SAM protein [Thalassospira xianhensis]